jgi:hypothetical protein
MRWSVGVEAEGDQVMTHDQILELADAVAGHNGVATGIGQQRYGAQVVVDADNRTLAELRAKEVFSHAVNEAGLPLWPISKCEALSEEEDAEPDMV